jgi:prefoldin subunit 5
MKTLEKRKEVIKKHIVTYENSLTKVSDKKLLGLNFSAKESDELMLERLKKRLKQLTNK